LKKLRWLYWHKENFLELAPDASAIEWLGVEIEQVIKPSNLAVAATAKILWELCIH
jgi:hypothetical protein